MRLLALALALTLAATTGRTASAQEEEQASAREPSGSPVGEPAAAAEDVSPAPSAVPDAPSALPAEVRSAHNSVFGELAGNALLYSLNYDRMLSEFFSLRAGTGLVAIFGATFVMANLLIGTPSHKFEVGAGPIVGYGSVFKADVALAVTTTLGYRYVPRDGGIFFKAGLTPLIAVVGPDALLWGGLAVGYTF